MYKWCLKVRCSISCEPIVNNKKKKRSSTHFFFLSYIYLNAEISKRFQSLKMYFVLLYNVFLPLVLVFIFCFMCRYVLEIYLLYFIKTAFLLVLLCYFLFSIIFKIVFFLLLWHKAFFFFRFFFLHVKSRFSLKPKEWKVFHFVSLSE